MSKKNKKGIVGSEGVSISGNHNQVHLSDAEKIRYLELVLEEKELIIRDYQSLSNMQSKHIIRLEKRVTFLELRLNGYIFHYNKRSK